MSGEIDMLCMEIYRKHKKALDLIYEYVKNSCTSVMVRNFSVEILPDYGYEMLYASRGYIRFIP